MNTLFSTGLFTRIIEFSHKHLHIFQRWPSRFVEITIVLEQNKIFINLFPKKTKLSKAKHLYKKKTFKQGQKIHFNIFPFINLYETISTHFYQIVYGDLHPILTIKHLLFALYGWVECLKKNVDGYTQ